MKILHLLDCYLPYLCGYSIRSSNILTWQKKFGHQPIAITLPHYFNLLSKNKDISLKEKEFIEDIPIHHYVNNNLLMRTFQKTFPMIVDSLEWQRNKRFYLKAAKKEHPFDIIHAHSPAENALFAQILSKKFHLPYLYEMRGVWEETSVACGDFTSDAPQYFKMKEEETQAMKRAKVVVTISEHLKNEVISRGIPEEKVYVVPNGVNTEYFSPKEKDKTLMRSLGLNGELVLGYISSLRKLEGIEYILDSLPFILKREKKVKVMIVGDGPERNRLESLVDQKGLQSYVMFTGKIEHHKILKYYSVIDIFVCPRIKARVNELVTPLKPYEAMAMGKAIVASDIGGLREILKNGETGLLFKAEDGKDLAGKFLSLIHNSKLRQTLEIQARQWVVQNRDWKVLIPKYERIYSRVMNGRRL